jgi:hypothetical protein
MGLPNNLGRLSPAITSDASLNIGVGVTPSGSFKLEVGTTSKFTGVATFGSTLSNGTYSYTLPSATGTLALVGGAGVGTVTSVAAITLGTTGTDLSSTVANSTTTPVITLNVPTASATNRGALSAADWTTFNNKTSNTGTVTSVATAGTVSGLTLTGGTITTSGTITLGGTLSLTAANVNAVGAITNSTSGNAATATALSSGQSNWSGTGVLGNVVGLLAWKNYSNSHVIFDASNSTSPSGTSVNNTNSQIAWSALLPTLMGWNGANTYGVRVDSARLADSATTATTATTTTGNAGSVTYLPNRTDVAAYQVLWGSAYTNGIGTIAYSCAAITIQSSTGTLNASIFSGSEANLGYSLHVNTANNAASAGGGITLWGAGDTTTSYIGFKNSTSTGWGVHGAITAGDYATYFVMDTVTRGWIFRYASVGGTNFAGTNVASISNTGVITANGYIAAGGGASGGFVSSTFSAGYNRIWSFGNATPYGLGYYQGGTDYIGFHFGATASPQFIFYQNGNSSFSGTVTAPTFSGAGTGLTGTAASLNIGGNAGTATYTTFVSSPDGGRNPNTAPLPNTTARALSYNFASATFITGATGNYAGVMTYAPWDGTSASTGDSSYQLAFCNWSGVNASGLPGLALRNGINSSWNSTWYQILHSGNVSSYTAGNVNSISSAVGGAYNWTGTNYFVSNRNTSSDSPPLQAYSNNGSGAIMSFHRGGYYAVNMGLDSDNVFRIGGWSAGANRLQLDMSGNLTVAGSMYASRFYDSDDASYYLDANGTSVLNAVNFYGNGNFLTQLQTATACTLYMGSNSWNVYADYGGWNLLLDRNGGSAIMYMYGLYATVGSVSDIRYKKNITPVTYGLNEILQINPIKYNYDLPIGDIRHGDTDNHLGLSAQEVQSIIPEAVHTMKGKDMLAMTYLELIPVLINGIKEQQVQIEELKQSINNLSN